MPFALAVLSTLVLAVTWLLGMTPFWWVILPFVISVAFIVALFLWGFFVVILFAIVAALTGDKI